MASLRIPANEKTGEGEYYLSAELRDWAQAFDLTPYVVVNRMRRGWSLVHAITAPATERDPLSGTRYIDDPAARIFVASNPSGADPVEVAEALGVSRSRVSQLEQSGLQKVLATLPVDITEGRMPRRRFRKVEDGDDD